LNFHDILLPAGIRKCSICDIRLKKNNKENKKKKKQKKNAAPGGNEVSHLHYLHLFEIVAIICGKNLTKVCL
jgi:hypothetical protein